MLYSIYILLFLSALWYTMKHLALARTQLPLPPGPPGHWLFGNELPTSRAPFAFAKLTQTYGPVVTLKKFNQVFIIIGRHRAAMDIMEKNGASTSDRPPAIAAGGILSGGMRLVATGMGDRLRKFRRIFHAMLQPKAATTYEPIHLQHGKNVLLDILNDPKNHQNHAKRYAASAIMSIVYGKTTPTSYNDPEVQGVLLCLKRLIHALRPGAYLVDVFPPLQYVPWYLTELRRWHQEELAFFQGQVDVVREQMRNGNARPCVAKFVVENQSLYEITNDEVAYIPGTMFDAGVDTVASAITMMMMAAALHPEAQARVQEELDAVVGLERLPSFGDQDMLPQVTAFMLESMRWRTVTIGGFPHRASADVIWENYLIPKGAVLIGNHWAISRDPEVFPDPEKFDPQRWLTVDGNVRDDLRFSAYGFGRRACPGMHVANRSVFINTALVLWAFRLSENPAAPIDSMAFTDTANIHALPFELMFDTRLPESKIRELCAVSWDEDS